MQKISKMTIWVIIRYFKGLPTSLESKEETSKFSKIFFCVYNFHLEKFLGVIFRL